MPLPKLYEKSILVRATKREKKEIERAAKETGLSISRYMVLKALR